MGGYRDLLAVAYCERLGLDPDAAVLGYSDRRWVRMPRWRWYQGARP
jgi:hypothetical protein